MYIVPAIPFATIAAICNNMPPQVKNITIAKFFASVTRSNGPLGKHLLSFAGSKGHVCTLSLVDFDPFSLFCFVVIILDFSEYIVTFL